MTNNALFHSTVLRRTLAGIGVLLVVLLLVALFFPWDMLRGPINRHVSEQLGRRFEITRHLSVQLGRTATVRADGVEIANPEWASKPYLVKATAAEFDIRLLPLLLGRIELPRIALTEPQIGLQIEPDGRRTWALSRDTSDEGSVPRIDALIIDKGTVDYQSAAQGANIHVQFSLARELQGQLPLSYKAAGKWQGEPFNASGRTGGVLQLSKDRVAPFPIEVDAVAGKTSLKAKGSISNLAELAGVDATFDLQGRNLEELYRLLGVVLPSTPPYKLRGKLAKHGKVWAATQIQGTLGNSDLSGALSFDQSAAVPLLTGKVQSRLLDFADLAPVIGLDQPEKAAANVPVSKTDPDSVAQSNKSVATGTTRKVLPAAALDVTRLQAMNADVIYSAADIRHVEVLPLDKGSVHVKLKAGVLQLEPVSLGIAGGTVAGSIRIDSNPVPAVFSTRLDLRAVQLNQLFPAIETSKSSLGKISGQLDLKGRGNSLAQMLGTSSGDVAVLMGKGEISNILLEFMGLDGGEVIKFLVRGDRNVQLRCAAAAFGVNRGLMTTKTIVLDTADTVINGRGTVNLADETLDLVLDPAPKDRSILSFRSPLKIGGTFASPSAGPDKGALAGRAAIAVGLGVINPLLALAATIETGPGQNENCTAILARAANSSAGSRMPASATK
ncbi:AsmA family protein [Polaromonas aquatica]|uniref:AsmA family protein n=1 Tax=Polaromonas aquatica TaxID=332657 RepID=UPI003D662ACA